MHAAISHSRISQLAAEVKENGGNAKMVAKWGEMGGNGGKWEIAKNACHKMHH